MLRNYFNILKENESEFEQDNVIKYEDMEKVPTGVEMSYSKDNTPITGTRIQYESEGRISFRMVMPKGTIFREHKHDCLETIVVYKGKLKDSKSNREIVKLESMSFPSFCSHTVEALEDSIFYVEFKKQ